MENHTHKKTFNWSDFIFFQNLFIFYNKNTKGFFWMSLVLVVLLSFLATTFSLFQQDVKNFIGTNLYQNIILNKTYLEKNSNILLFVLVFLVSIIFSIFYYFLIKIKYTKIEYQKTITGAYTILLLEYARCYSFKKMPDLEISEKLEMYNSRARSGVVETFSLLLDIPKILCSLLVLLLILGAFTKAYVATIFLTICFGFYFRIKLDNEAREAHTEQSSNRIMIQNSVSIFSQSENMRSFENVKSFQVFIDRLTQAQNKLRDFSFSFANKRSKVMALSMFADAVAMFLVLVYFISQSENSNVFNSEIFLKSSSFSFLYIYSFTKLVEARAMICELFQKLSDAKIAKKIFVKDVVKVSKKNYNQKLVIKNISYKEVGGEYVFKGLNFSAVSGRIYGLYFPAMSGSTLFAKIISGQKSVTCGTVKTPQKLIYFPSGNVFPPNLTVAEKIFGDQKFSMQDIQVKNILSLTQLNEKIFLQCKLTSSEKVLVKYARLIFLIKNTNANSFVVVDYDQDGLPDSLYKKIIENIVDLCKEKNVCLMVIHSNKKIENVFDKKLEMVNGVLVKSI